MMPARIAEPGLCEFTSSAAAIQPFGSGILTAKFAGRVFWIWRFTSVGHVLIMAAKEKCILKRSGALVYDTKNKANVLFLCTGNSCRSQMAEGWARYLKSDVIEAYSAGIRPIGVSSRAIKVMAEAGVDISAHRSEHIDDHSGVDFDYVSWFNC